MSGLERITQLSAPPVVGRRYLVPTVAYPWLCSWNERSIAAATRPWPVFLPKHEDAEHLNFPHQHYHVDPRFLNKADARRAAAYHVAPPAPDLKAGLEYTAQRMPLYIRGRDDHPPVVWMARRCFRSEITYRFGGYPTIQKLRDHYHGQQCAKGRSGWVCPHKRYPLGSIAADENGILTCPLHGLQIDSKTGHVVGGLRSAPAELLKVVAA